jgi:hypothetical protein
VEGEEGVGEAEEDEGSWLGTDDRRTSGDAAVEDEEDADGRDGVTAAEDEEALDCALDAASAGLNTPLDNQEAFI